MKRREFTKLPGGAAVAWPVAVSGSRGRQITIWMGRPNNAGGHRLAVAFRR
jgi:hypothetical protein